jgi:hypothetical protein
MVGMTWEMMDELEEVQWVMDTMAGWRRVTPFTSHEQAAWRRLAAREQRLLEALHLVEVAA